jgi:hypothetical protein
MIEETSIVDLTGLTCTQEETFKRIEFCGPCDHNVLDVFPKCNQCDCPISSLASMNFKSCPIGKW